MSSIFGTGQSTNATARIMKANQMSKVCASSQECPHVEKIKNLCDQNFKGNPADCHGKRINHRAKRKAKTNLRAKRNTSEQKKKPHGKKKKTLGKKNNLTAKEKRIKNVLSTSKKFCRESFSFCRKVFPFAVRLILLP